MLDHEVIYPVLDLVYGVSLAAVELRPEGGNIADGTGAYALRFHHVLKTVIRGEVGAGVPLKGDPCALRRAPCSGVPIGNVGSTVGSEAEKLVIIVTRVVGKDLSVLDCDVIGLRGVYVLEAPGGVGESAHIVIGVFRTFDALFKLRGARRLSAVLLAEEGDILILRGI